MQQVLPPLQQHLRKLNRPWLWKQGESGNAAGRAKFDPVLQAKARTFTPAILDKLFNIIVKPNSSTHERLKAAELLLKFCWTKKKEFPDGQQMSAAEYVTKTQLANMGFDSDFVDKFIALEKDEQRTLMETFARKHKRRIITCQ